MARNSHRMARNHYKMSCLAGYAVFVERLGILGNPNVPFFVSAPEFANLAEIETPIGFEQDTGPDKEEEHNGENNCSSETLL
mmetsp:Transcript_16590/g.37984  ORF Transcript_16590/g.37984 Transcript_16590/m.37984 type:complete len:82 (+) Transcript_16590:1134-1379(+)